MFWKKVICDASEMHSFQAMLNVCINIWDNVKVNIDFFNRWIHQKNSENYVLRKYFQPYIWK